MDTPAMPASPDTQLSIPKLTGENYSQWAPLMRNVLKNSLVWGIVQGREKEPSAEDKKESFFTRQDFATSQIFFNCDSTIQEKFVDVEDPAELWKALKENSEKSNLVSEYWLRKRLYSIELADCESVEAYVGMIQETVDEIDVCNPEEPIGPAQHCFVLCDGLPADWLPLIESLHKAGRTSRNPAELILQFFNHERLLKKQQELQEQKRLRVPAPEPEYGQGQRQGLGQQQQEQQEQEQQQGQEQQQEQQQGQEQQQEQQQGQEQEQQEREQEREQDNSSIPGNEPPNPTAENPARSDPSPQPQNCLFQYRQQTYTQDLEAFPVSFYYTHNLPIEFQYYLCSPASTTAFMTNKIHELYPELCRRIYINDRKEKVIFSNQQVGDVCIYIKPAEVGGSSAFGENSSAGANTSSEGGLELTSRKLLLDWIFETPDWRQILCDYFWDIPKISGKLSYMLEVEYKESCRVIMYFDHEREFESLGITLEMFFPPEYDEAVMC